jgi:hypothetical protein
LLISRPLVAVGERHDVQARARLRRHERPRRLDRIAAGIAATVGDDDDAVFPLSRSRPA